MKCKSLWPFIMLVILLNSCATKPKVIISPSFKTKRAKIAILPFSSVGKKDINFNESDKLTTYCIEMGFIVVERTKLQEVFEELNLELTGALSKNNIDKVGKILGVDIIVFGNREYRTVSKGCLGGGGSELKLVSQTIRFVDVATGVVLISAYSEAGSQPERITRQMALAIKDRILLYIDLRERK